MRGVFTAEQSIDLLESEISFVFQYENDESDQQH